VAAVKRPVVSSFIQTLVRIMCFSFFIFLRLRFLRYSRVLSDPCIVRMSLMRDVHLRNLDLNLIHPLHALLEECHVTRAAKRIS